MVMPQLFSVEEIQEYIQLYTRAARNAISVGFNGVEIHGTNSYPLDQFMRDIDEPRLPWQWQYQTRSEYGI